MAERFLVLLFLDVLDPQWPLLITAKQNTAVRGHETRFHCIELFDDTTVTRSAPLNE